MDYTITYNQADGTSKKLTFKSYNDALSSARVLVKGHHPVSHVQLSTPYGLKEYIKNHPEGQDQLTDTNLDQSQPAK